MSGCTSRAGRSGVLPGRRSFSGGAGFTCTRGTRRHPGRPLRGPAPCGAGRERASGGCRSGRTLASAAAPLGWPTCGWRPELGVGRERPGRGEGESTRLCTSVDNVAQEPSPGRGNQSSPRASPGVLGGSPHAEVVNRAHRTSRVYRYIVLLTPLPSQGCAAGPHPCGYGPVARGVAAGSPRRAEESGRVSPPRRPRDPWSPPDARDPRGWRTRG